MCYECKSVINMKTNVYIPPLTFAHFDHSQLTISANLSQISFTYVKQSFVRERMINSLRKSKMRFDLCEDIIFECSSTHCVCKSVVNS